MAEWNNWPDTNLSGIRLLGEFDPRGEVYELTWDSNYREAAVPATDQGGTR